MDKDLISEVSENIDEDLPLVLVVDDDEICQQFIIKQLKEENMIVKCETAMNVSEAVNLIEEQIKKEQNFDIVFLDMYLKDNTYGIDLLKIIRDNGWLNEALIIVMSGTEDSNIVEKCYNFRIQNFLKKPITKVNFKNEIIKVKKKHQEQVFCPIKNYKYIKYLGEGTNGKVVLVKNKITKEKYAMKTIKIQNNEDGAQKESEEMEYLKGINSPTVIKLKEFDIITGNLYLIIEYAEFGTLSDVIKSYATKKDHIPDDMIINWMTEILLGLYHIHEMGVLHRDIKSENLFLCKNSVVKIGDLGAARALGEGARAATMVGTTYYMSPEVMMNKDYSNIIDIWSVGVVFFELLSNTLPFKGLDAEEIKKKVVNVDYNLDLIPKTRNPELISLLKKMLVLKPEDRWKAIDCLQFRLINERLHYLLEEKIFEMDDDAKAKLMNIMPKLENNKVNISDGDKERIFSYFTDLEKAKKVDCTSIKSVYNPGFFKTKVYNVISGVDLDNSVNDLQLKQKDIEELLEKNLIMNINTPTSKELDYSNRVNYKVVTDEDPHIDNSIKYPFEQPKEDPLGLSIKCSIAVDKVLNKFNDEGQLDDGVDENVLKYKISTCKEYFDFLIEIRKLRKIVLSKCSKDQKLAIILNIYLTMFKHYQIKSYVSNSDYVPSMIENIFSMVFKPKSQIDVIYDIGGTVISLYEMKHIVIRRNKKPFEHYFFNLAGSSDPRINMINITNNSILERLLLICIDPVDNIDDYNLNLGYFEDNKIEEQIENRCKGFFQDNIKIDSGQILVPKFLQNYVKDFGPNPTDIIKFLLRFNTDPDVKANYVIKNFNENKVQINWY